MSSPARYYNHMQLENLTRINFMAISPLLRWFFNLITLEAWKTYAQSQFLLRLYRWAAPYSLLTPKTSPASRQAQVCLLARWSILASATIRQSTQVKSRREMNRHWLKNTIWTAQLIRTWILESRLPVSHAWQKKLYDDFGFARAWRSCQRLKNSSLFLGCLLLRGRWLACLDWRLKAVCNSKLVKHFFPVLHVFF